MRQFDEVMADLASVVDGLGERLTKLTQQVNWSDVDLDFADVILGLSARQYQLWSVAVMSASVATAPVYPLILRGLADATITGAWIVRHPEAARAFKLYSAGRLKLLSAHWAEYGSGDSWAEQYAEQLKDIASSEQWSELLPVELGSWSGKDVRSMAIECDLKEMYDTAYSPLSAEAHAEWMTLRGQYMRLCEEELHRSHWLPLFDRSSRLAGMPGLATRYLSVSIESCLPALGLRIDEGEWESIVGRVEGLWVELDALAEGRLTNST